MVHGPRYVHIVELGGGGGCGRDCRCAGAHGQTPHRAVGRDFRATTPHRHLQTLVVAWGIRLNFVWLLRVIMGHSHTAAAQIAVRAGGGAEVARMPGNTGPGGQHSLELELVVIWRWIQEPWPFKTGWKEPFGRMDGWPTVQSRRPPALPCPDTLTSLGKQQQQQVPRLPCMPSPQSPVLVRIIPCIAWATHGAASKYSATRKQCTAQHAYHSSRR